MLKDYPAAFSAQLKQIEQRVADTLGAEDTLVLHLLPAKLPQTVPADSSLCDLIAVIESSSTDSFRLPGIPSHLDEDWMNQSQIPSEPGRYPLPKGFYSWLLRHTALLLCWADKVKTLPADGLASEESSMAFSPQQVVNGAQGETYAIDVRDERFPVLARFSVQDELGRLLENPVLVVGKQGGDYLCKSLADIPLPDTSGLKSLAPMGLDHPDFQDTEQGILFLTTLYELIRVPARYIDQPEPWYQLEAGNAVARCVDDYAKRIKVNAKMPLVPRMLSWQQRLMYDYVLPGIIVTTGAFAAYRLLA